MSIKRQNDVWIVRLAYELDREVDGSTMSITLQFTSWALALATIGTLDPKKCISIDVERAQEDPDIWY